MDSEPDAQCLVSVRSEVYFVEEEIWASLDSAFYAGRGSSLGDPERTIERGIEWRACMARSGHDFVDGADLWAPATADSRLLASEDWLCFEPHRERALNQQFEVEQLFILNNAGRIDEILN